jgi:hypothetical protein
MGFKWPTSCGAKVGQPASLRSVGYWRAPMKDEIRAGLMRAAARWGEDLWPILEATLLDATELESEFNSLVDRQIGWQHNDDVNHALRAGLPKPRRPLAGVRLRVEIRSGGSRILWERLNDAPSRTSGGSYRRRYTPIPMLSRFNVDMGELLQHVPPDQRGLAQQLEKRASGLREAMGMLANASAKLGQIWRQCQHDRVDSPGRRRLQGKASD